MLLLDKRVRHWVVRLFFAAWVVPCAARGVHVTLSPSAANAITDNSQEFTALVEGTAHKIVRWSVCDSFGKNCIPNGNAQVGKIVEVGRDGLGNPRARYTAPHVLPVPSLCHRVLVGQCLLTIKVKLARRSDKRDTATVTIQEPTPPQPTLTISPQDPEVTLGGTIQFSATVTNAKPDEVIWSAANGTITAEGLYTTPSSLYVDWDNVWATLRDHPVTPAFSRVLIDPPAPTIDAINPNPASAGETVTIQGSGFYGRLTLTFPGPNGIPLIAEGRSQSLTELTVTVPKMAVSGPVHLVASLVGHPPMQSNLLSFHRLPKLRIRVESKDLAQGETTPMFVRILGEEIDHKVVWSAERGTVSPGGIYQAPGAITDVSFDRVTGCIENTDACDSVLLGLHPFRIEPAAPIVKQGETLQLTALQSGQPLGATWAIEAGGGSIQQDGTYTAPSSREESGGVAITATWHGQQEQVAVAVMGGSPGLVNRVSDYIDLTQPWPAGYGTFAQNLAMRGNRGYVVATDSVAGLFDQKDYWLDVYNLKDPLRPVWIDAVESASRPDLFGTDGTWLYEVAIRDAAAGGSFPSTIAIYDVRGDHPMLVKREIVPSLSFSGSSLVNGVLYAFPQDLNPSTLQVYRFDLRSGSVATTLLTLSLPDPGRSYLVSSVTSSADRLYVGLQQELPSGWASMVAAYDLSTTPPTLLGTGEGYASTLRLVEGSLLSDFAVYDLSSGHPLRIATLPERVFSKDALGPLVVADTLQTGLRILDMSDPANPRLTATLFDQVGGCTGGGWVGSYVLCAEGGGGLAILDAKEAGGMRQISRVYTGGFQESAAYDLILKPPLIYTAGSSDVGAVLSISDVTTGVPRFVNSIYDQDEPAVYAMAWRNDILFLGMPDYIGLYNVTAPTDPRLFDRYPLPVSSLLLVDNILYVGTLDNRVVILNVLDPRAPQELAEVSLPGLPYNIRRVGDLVYIAAESGGLQIYDVLDPAHPILLSQLTSSTMVYDVDSDGTTAYLAAGEDGLIIADVSNPIHPTVVSRTPLADYYPFFPLDSSVQAISVRIREGIVFVGTLDANGIVYGFDPLVPLHPRVVGMTGEGDFILTWVGKIEFQGNDAYIAGFLGDFLGVKRNSASLPRNAIDFYYLPDVLRHGGPKRALASLKTPEDPEFILRCPARPNGCSKVLAWKRP